MMKTIIFKKIPLNYKAELQRLKKECFGWVITLNSIQKIEHEDKFCSGADIIIHILVAEYGKIIGHTAVLKRKIKFQEGELILGGFGGVCVKKEKRKMGIAKKMLKKSIDELKKAGCDIVYLCTNVKEKWMVDFYGKYGFVILGRKHTYLGKSGKRYFDDDSMIAPINSEEKFQDILKTKEPFDIGRGNW